MKKLLSILLLLPLVSLAQTILPTDTVTLFQCEYQLGMIWNGHAYGAGGGSTGQGSNTGPLGTMIAAQFANGTNPRVKTGAGSLHSWFVVVDSASHQMYGTGLNDGCWEGTCSAGAVSNFVAVPGATNIKQVWASALPGTIAQTQFVIVVKYDGTVWRLGTKTGGLPGDGTSYSSGDDSVLVEVPGLAHIASVTGMFMPIAIDSSGLAYDWGNAGGVFGVFLGRSGSYLSPGQIVVPGGEPVTEAAGGELVNYLRGANGHLLSWGLYNSMMGIGVSWASNSSVTTVTDITSSMAIGAHRSFLHIAKMMTSSIAILYDSAANDSIVATWGDNPQGSVGTGNQLNYYLTTNPFQWDVGHGENVVSTVQFPLPCVTDAAEIYNGGYFVDYNFVKSRKNKFRFAGRNKNGIACCNISGDGSGNIDSNYPDSWNDTTFRLINFFNGANYKVQSPWCIAHPTATSCPLYTDPGEAAPTNSAGSNFTATSLPASLTGTATPTSGYTIAQVQWSGPCGIVFSNPFTNSPTVTGLSAGPNILTMKATDNFGKVSTANVTVTFSSATQTNFYFSAAGTGTACTNLLPCPATYFPSITWAAGDTASFNRGDTFPYEFTMSASGAAGNPIVMTAYGTGADPIISGMTSLFSFTNVAGNLWQTAFSGPYPAILSHNGILQVRGRTPNITTGYFLPTAMSTNTFTDAANAAKAPIGDTIVGGGAPQNLDKRVVTGNSAGVITVSPNFTYNNAGALRWFVFTAPDSALEYRDSSGYVQVYSVGSPSGTYGVPTNGIPLRLSGNYIQVIGLHIMGSDTANVVMSGAHDKLYNDSLDYGFDGVQINGAVSDTLQNCYIAHMADNGVQKIGNSNYNDVYLNDFIYDIGMFPGQGTSGGGENYWGIIAGDSGSIVKNVSLDSIGGGGIAFFGSGAIISTSTINKFGQILEDVAGVYSWAASLPTYARERVVDSVVITNGGGPQSHNGVTANFSSAVSGVYMDSYAIKTLIEYCSILNVNSNAILVKAANDTVIYNKAFGSGYSDFVALSQSGSTITNLYVEHNQFGSTVSGLAAVRFLSTANDLNIMCASCDNNQLAGAIGSTQPFYTVSSVDGGTFRTLASFTTNTGYDAHSTFQTGSLQFLYNASGTSGAQSLWTKYQDLNGALYPGTVTVPGYSSVLLFIWHLGFQTKHKVGKYFYN